MVSGGVVDVRAMTASMRRMGECNERIARLSAATPPEVEFREVLHSKSDKPDNRRRLRTTGGSGVDRSRSSGGSTRRWPRRPCSGPGRSCPAGHAGPPRVGPPPATASASASRSSLLGPSSAGSGASRTISQPRGAVSRSPWTVAQVVAVRFGVGGQRPEHGGGVGVDVRQRHHGRSVARGSRATPHRTHAA